MDLDSLITVLIPTSAIPRHPSTDLLESCLNSILHYLPNARVVIMADGVRPSLSHRRAQYDEYIRRVGEACERREWGPNVQMRPFHTHSQQAIMTRTMLETVDTPLMMFVEHDALLRIDPPLDIEAIARVLLDGQANMVRLYAWPEIWHEHAHLMRGTFEYAGHTWTRTVQYSQWPLFATTEFHLKMLKKHIRPNQIAMIESILYGPVCAATWDVHKIVIYGPDGSPTLCHKNGRMDEVTGVRDPADW